jgi:hypothetical protein
MVEKFCKYGHNFSFRIQNIVNVDQVLGNPSNCSNCCDNLTNNILCDLVLFHTFVSWNLQS